MVEVFIPIIINFHLLATVDTIGVLEDIWH